MRVTRWIAMLASLLVATSAFAQGDLTQSGVKPTGAGGAAQPVKIIPIGGASSDSVRWVLPINTAGTGVATSDISRDRDNTLTTMLFTGTIFSDTTSFCSDSTSQPLDVHSYRFLKLVFFITPQDSSFNTAGDNYFRFAVQLREHINGITDSTGVASEYGLPESNNGVTKMGTAAPQTDSLQIGQITQPLSRQVGSDEFEIIVDQGRQGTIAAGQINPKLPRGIAIPIQWYGSPHQFMKLSVRFRMLGYTFKARCKYTVWLLGWS